MFNDKKVVPDISKNGIRIASSGLYIIVEIPELEVYVSYSRLAFYIKLPFGKYYSNTMGLCGECAHQLTVKNTVIFPPSFSFPNSCNFNDCYVTEILTNVSLFDRKTLSEDNVLSHFLPLYTFAGDKLFLSSYF